MAAMAWPNQHKLGARSFTQVSHVTGAQALGPASVGILGTWSEMGQAVPTRDVGTCYAIMLALQGIFFLIFQSKILYSVNLSFRSEGEISVSQISKNREFINA